MIRYGSLFHNTLKRYCTRSLDKSRSALTSLKEGDCASQFRTITEDDVLNFATLTGDYNTVHINSTKKIVHGAFLNGLVSGLLGTKLPGPGTMVVEQSLNFPQSCYVGDTVEVKVQLISVRKIIRCEFSCVTAEGKIVLNGNARLIVKKL